MNPTSTDPNPRESALFKRWYEGVAASFTVHSTDIQSVDHCIRNGKKEVLFIKLSAALEDQQGRTFTRIFFLRGPSVALLVILICEGVEYALLVKQARPAIGSAACPELPAGMVEKEGVESAALRELEEETGITVAPHEIDDLCSLFYSGACKGVYPSPGACDEIVHLFLCRKTVTPDVIATLHGKQTGNAHEHEHIVIELVRLEDLCVSTHNPSAHSAFIMYHTLKQKGVLT